MSDRDKRFAANFPVVLRQGPEMFCATICNISSGGGCIVGVEGLNKGDTAVMDYDVGQTRAVVMWSIGKMAGLMFETRLSARGLNSIRAAVPVPA